MQYMPDICRCIYGNMPDIYFLEYTAICRTYIVACRRQYAGAENICVRLLPLPLQLHIPPQTICPIWHIIALLHFCIIAICRSAENMYCAMRLLALSKKLLLPKCLSNSAVYSQWTFVQLKITSSQSWRQMSTYFLKYKNPSQLSGGRRK